MKSEFSEFSALQSKIVLPMSRRATTKIAVSHFMQQQTTKKPITVKRLARSLAAAALGNLALGTKETTKSN